MTFRQMEIFTAVCECGSITTASRAYHISPQGISHTIRELEEELGCLLLNRSVSGVTVSPVATCISSNMRFMSKSRSNRRRSSSLFSKLI